MKTTEVFLGDNTGAVIIPEGFKDLALSIHGFNSTCDSMICHAGTNRNQVSKHKARLTPKPRKENRKMKTTQATVTLAKLCEQSNIPPRLVRGVVRQMGGWENFTQSAPDIFRYGIDGGFCGFAMTPIPLILALLIALLGLLAFAAIVYCAVARCPECQEFHTDDNEELLCTLEQADKR